MRRLWRHWFCVCFCMRGRQKPEDPQFEPHSIAWWSFTWVVYKIWDLPYICVGATVSLGTKLWQTLLVLKRSSLMPLALGCLVCKQHQNQVFDKDKLASWTHPPQGSSKIRRCLGVDSWGVLILGLVNLQLYSLFLHMVNHYLIIFEAWWILNECVFYCFTIVYTRQWILT